MPTYTHAHIKELVDESKHLFHDNDWHTHMPRCTAVFKQLSLILIDSHIINMYQFIVCVTHSDTHTHGMHCLELVTYTDVEVWCMVGKENGSKH